LESLVKRFTTLFLLGIPLVLYLSQGHEESEAANAVIFIVSAISLIPLARFVEGAVEELAELFGQFVGGLLHTTFGNLAELAIGISIILATAQHTITNGPEIVRASIAGAVIRNSLLFLGVATILGCWRNGKMKFDAENASQYSTVFALAVIGLALPGVANLLHIETFSQENAVLPSIVVAAILVVSYLAYVLFSVFRLAAVADARGARAERRRQREERRERKQRARRYDQMPIPAVPDINALFEQERATAEARLAEEEAARASGSPERKRGGAIDPKSMRREAEKRERAERGEEETGWFSGHPALRALAAVVVLGASAAGVVVMSEHFVHSIEPVATQFLGGNELFIGLIVIPVIGGAVELIGAVSTARHNRMEITMAVTAGASIQTILFVAPILVFVAAAVGVPFTLIFQPLALLVFISSTFVFMLLGRDGESTWLEGVQLTAFWLLTASTAFFLHAG
jgi:Ca2+:H+ antiporter